MKINIISVPVREVVSFTMFCKPDLELLKQTKKIFCSIHRIGKTRISTSIQFGEYCVNVNIPIEGYKLFEYTEWHYFSGFRQTHHYFVISKKQNFEVYKEYLQKVITKAIEYYHIELDELTVELECSGF
jgi:hypothetical protein